MTEDDLDWLGGLPLQQRVSLGQPRHGTPQGTYAVWLDGALAIQHLRCDFRATQRKLAHLPLDPELVQDLQTILERGGL